MSNKHSQLTDTYLHNPKGFTAAGRNTVLSKNELGLLEFKKSGLMGAALSIVDITAAPPDETSGNIYITDNSGESLEVARIQWQSGNTVRYLFAFAYDLSGYSAGQWLESIGAVLAVHDGVFLITAVNDGSQYIEVTNTLITDATTNELAGSFCTVTHEDWDGVGKNYWCKFDGATWQGASTETGLAVYVKDIKNICVHDGVKFVPAGIITKQLHITSAQILALNSAPVTIIPAPGAGYLTVISQYVAKYNFGTIAYATAADLNLIYATSGEIIGDFNTFLQAVASVIKSDYQSKNSLSVNEAVVLTDAIADPTNGDGTLDVWVMYYIVKV